MLKSKRVILFILLIVLIFSSCKKDDYKIQFSFEQIQNKYNEEIQKIGPTVLCPFYFDKKLFTSIEQELNTLITNSDYCSVMISVNIDNGLFDICALYNKKKEVYFNVWEYYEKVKKQTLIKNPNAIKILKKKPKQSVLIENGNICWADCTSTYIIKKIGKKTYYYANYVRQGNGGYDSLINLFGEGYKTKPLYKSCLVWR